MKYELVQTEICITSEPGDRWVGKTTGRYVHVTSSKLDRGVPSGVTVLKCGDVKTREGKSITLMLSLQDKPDLRALIVEWEAAMEAQKNVKAAAERAEYEAMRAGLTPIVLHYCNGEHLSGYEVFGAGALLLKEISLARDIEGWGCYVSCDRVEGKSIVEALGTSFRFSAALEFVRPALDVKAAKKREADEALAAKFGEAKSTGKPVKVVQWSESCDDPQEECNMDMCVQYAMPDGTIKITRSHTW